MERLFCPDDFQLLQERLKGGKCVMGRKTHEQHPNHAGRQRYILSRRFNNSSDSKSRYFSHTHFLEQEIDKDPDQTWYVLGGGDVYRLFGKRKLYTEFNLSIRHDVMLGQGIVLSSGRVFPGADILMKQWGLGLTQTTSISDHVTLNQYTLLSPP